MAPKDTANKIADTLPGFAPGSTKRNLLVGAVYVLIGLAIVSAALGGPNVLDSIPGEQVGEETPTVTDTPTPTETNSTDTTTATPVSSPASPTATSTGNATAT